MKGKGVEEKVKFTTLQNGDVTRNFPLFLGSHADSMDGSTFGGEFDGN
jgi:hypothetical protein